MIPGEQTPRRRAGTPLTLDLSQRANLFFDYRDRYRTKPNTQHGTVDLENRFYQAGGQRSDFYFRNSGEITMPIEIWNQLVGPYVNLIDYVEWYDREEDVAYRVAFADAIEFGHPYEQGIGVRWGIKQKYFRLLSERVLV